MWNLNNVKQVLAGFSAAGILLNCIALTPLESALLWSPTVNLSLEGKNAVNPQVSINPAGYATVIWSRSNGSNYVVQATSGKGAGPWTNPGRLSYVGQDAFFANIANDNANNSIAIWSRSNGTNNVIQAAYKESRGNWSAPVNLSKTGKKKNSATNPQMAIDPEGHVTAVWQRNDGVSNVIQSAVKKKGKDWSKTVDITVAGPTGFGDINPAIAVDKWGTAYCIWINSSTFTVRGAKKPFSGDWSAPIDISQPGGQVSSACLVVDANGHPSAVWSRSNGQNSVIQTSSSGEHGQPSAPIDLSLPEQDAITPQIAVDAMGNKVVVWLSFDGINTIVQGAVQYAGGTWSLPMDISLPGQDAADPQIMIDRAGNVVAAWRRSDGANFIIEASTATFGAASWSVPVGLSAPGEDALNPQLALDSSGNVVVVWQRSNGANSIIQASFGQNVKGASNH